MGCVAPCSPVNAHPTSGLRLSNGSEPSFGFGTSWTSVLTQSVPSHLNRPSGVSSPIFGDIGKSCSYGGVKGTHPAHFEATIPNQHAFVSSGKRRERNRTDAWPLGASTAMRGFVAVEADLRNP